MRGVKVILFIAALLFVLPARAQENVSYFGFDFPLKIGALTRGDVTNFEKDNPGLGYGIRYTAPGQRVDIFIYNLGKRRIEDDVFSLDQNEELSRAIADVHRAKERNLYRNVIEGAEFESPAVKNPFFRCRAFVIDRGEGRVEDSVLCLGARNDKFFKVRISSSPPAPGVAERADALLRQIGRATKF
jgi:hypothetical protein